AVVALGPNVLAGLCLDQLCGDADAVAGFTQTTFEHISDTELAPDLFHVDSAALVGEAGVARDHKQRRVARERSDDVLGDAVGEELLLGISAHIGERQYRY